MSGDAIQLTIPYETVSEFFNCPVCMCQLKNTHITMCGHRYCEKCIKECVDRLHKCPCCNKPLNSKQLMRDHQFDDLIETMMKEKDVSEKKYFESLIDEDFQQNPHSTSKVFSPIELVLKKHVKESLAAHEKYYQDMKKDLQKQKEVVNSDFENRKEELLSSGLSAEEISQRIMSLQDEMNSQKEMLDQELERTTMCIAETYDNYLTQHLPRLTILPITVTVILLSKNITFTDVILKPEDSISDIKRIISAQLQTNGDKLISFSDDVKFFSFGPFVNFSGHEMFHMVKDIIEHGATHPDIKIIPDLCKPVLQLSMKPSSTVAVYGKIICESDMPKQCFAKSFKKGQVQSMDYFTCQDCKFNWICRSCMEVCHKHHNVVLYIMKHQPTWACCYCPKKKKCVIQDSPASSSIRPVSSLF